MRLVNNTVWSPTECVETKQYCVKTTPVRRRRMKPIAQLPPGTERSQQPPASPLLPTDVCTNRITNPATLYGTHTKQRNRRASRSVIAFTATKVAHLLPTSARKNRLFATEGDKYAFSSVTSTMKYVNGRYDAINRAYTGSREPLVFLAALQCDVDAAYCYRQSSVVCLSVGLSRSRAAQKRLN